MAQVWGGRFTKPLDPLTSGFNNSLHFDEVLYKHDIKGSVAHAKMLAKQGLIQENECELIISTLKKIEKKIENKEVVIEPFHEDIHVLIEYLLIQELGDVGKKIHTARSRNDQVALDMRLYFKDVYEITYNLLKNLINCLDTLSEKHKEDKIPGYTHLQQAQPTTLGTHLGVYKAMFKRDLNRLMNCKDRMDYCPLGAGALAGTTLPIDRNYTAELLGFKGIVENTIDAVSDRDYLIEYTNFSSMVMLHLSRLCEDLIIWATQEFNFITLDDGFATGSSRMPNKKNPDIPELIRGKSGRVFGHAISLLSLMKGLPLSYNKDLQEDKECFFDTVKTLHTCLGITTPFLFSINFNTETMAKIVDSGFLAATDLVDSYTLQGIPFRDAHHKVGKIVLEASKKGMNLKEYLSLQSSGNGN